MFLFYNSTVNKDYCILYLVYNNHSEWNHKSEWSMSDIIKVEEKLRIQPVYFNR